MLLFFLVCTTLLNSILKQLLATYIIHAAHFSEALDASSRLPTRQYFDNLRLKFM